MSSASQEFLKKDTQNFTQDDWIQFLELLESLGGSAAIKAARDSPTKRVNLPIVERTAASEVLNLEFTDVGPVTIVRSVNNPPPSGKGHFFGERLPVGIFSGNVTLTEVPLVNTKWAILDFSSGQMRAEFFDNEDGQATGHWLANEPWHDPTIPRTQGIFRFFVLN